MLKKFQNIESKHLFVSIRYNVKCFGLWYKYDLLDQANLKFLIYV